MVIGHEITHGFDDQVSAMIYFRCEGIMFHYALHTYYADAAAQAKVFCGRNSIVQGVLYTVSHVLKVKILQRLNCTQIFRYQAEKPSYYINHQ
jgi:hypothetical protein